MIGQECIDELADFAGLKAHVAAITERAMRGEIEFEPALRERVALLKDMPVGVVDEVLKKRITATPGGRELVMTMRANGAYTCLISGGFTLFTNAVAAMIGFQENRANELKVADGKLTGEVTEPILGRATKLATLIELTKSFDLDDIDTLVTGDGANDLGMIEAAGLGVAYHAKPAVAAAAAARIDHGDLTALLYAQGYRRDEFVTGNDCDRPGTSDTKHLIACPGRPPRPVLLKARMEIHVSQLNTRSAIASACRAIRCRPSRPPIGGSRPSATANAGSMCGRVAETRDACRALMARADAGEIFPCSACCSASRTISTSRACRRRRPARLSAICRNVGRSVERLIAAGAICIGKTNLDQLATGLSGARSPYGTCASVANPRYISGGSSSGSAVAVGPARHVRARHRYRRLGPHPRRLQRHRRHQADRRTGVVARAGAELPDAGLRLDLLQLGAGRRAILEVIEGFDPKILQPRRVRLPSARRAGASSGSAASRHGPRIFRHARMRRTL